MVVVGGGEQVDAAYNLGDLCSRCRHELLVGYAAVGCVGEEDAVCEGNRALVAERFGWRDHKTKSFGVCFASAFVFLFWPRTRALQDTWAF